MLVGTVLWVCALSGLETIRLAARFRCRLRTLGDSACLSVSVRGSSPLRVLLRRIARTVDCARLCGRLSAPASRAVRRKRRALARGFLPFRVRETEAPRRSDWPELRSKCGGYFARHHWLDRSCSRPGGSLPAIWRLASDTRSGAVRLSPLPVCSGLRPRSAARLRRLAAAAGARRHHRSRRIRGACRALRCWPASAVRACARVSWPALQCVSPVF